tara:strand:- start:297 stop:497 length:201 start_codon:yes stop_codon:yes gene_type:complete
MESFEKKLLLELLEAIKKCDDRLKTLEEVLYVADDEMDEVVTPISKELYDAVKEATGSGLVFMAIA